MSSSSCSTLSTQQTENTISKIFIPSSIPSLSMEGASLAGGAMASLAVKLNSILMPKYELMTGARADVLFLRAELESMHAFLERFSMVCDPNAQVKAWTKEVRELAYDVEDIMDEFMHRVDAYGSTRHGSGTLRVGFTSRVARLVTTAWTHLRFSSELRGLKARAIEVSERQSRYRCGDDIWVLRDHMAVDPRINALYADVPDLVGMNGPTSDIVEWLMGSTTTLKVLSIVGFGGLGKTTLAMEVFRRVRGQFGCHAFTAVSQKLDMKKLLKDLLSQVAQGEVNGVDTWEEGQLIRKLKECLLNRRYLIIIDDVWSKSAWEKVRCALPQNNHNSRLLTTTRIESIAKLCCSEPDDRVYRIDPLNESDSKVLFFKRIFGDNESCPPQLKGVSDQILKKCCGSPLAIISIASLLASKPVMLKEQWEKLLVSIGSALEKNPDLEGMKQILSLSYYDLPYHLKTCLLYLSLYPEDFKIERDSLIQQWIAEGFVGVERGLSVEDVAEGYFNELINRSMVQPMDINCDGRAHACRVHDVMLELIVSKAIEENFVTLFGYHPVPISSVQGNVLRLSIQCDSEISKTQGEMNLHHVRTLTSFVQANLVPSLSEFRVLRVLNLEGCQGFSENHLKDINILFHLKYLSLRRTWIANLPPQIGDLQTLETLDIRDTNIEELPGTITGLDQLKHIISGGHTWGKIKLPDGIGNMTSLRTISGFDICRSSACAVQELGNLKSLMELAINWTDFTSGNVKHQEAMMRTLGKLGTSNLQSFAVCSRNFGSLEFLDSWSPPPNCLQKFRLSAYYFLPRVPRWMASLCNLIDLNINIAELTDEDIIILRELPSLLRLNLWLKSPQKDRIVLHGVGFPYLKELLFSCEGTCLIFEPASVPKLETLHTTVHVIKAKAYSHQFGMEHLKSIKQISIQVFCYGASASEIKDFEHAISTSVKYHANHPRMNIKKHGIDLIIEESNKREYSEDKNVEEYASKDVVNHTNKKRRKLQIEEHNSSSAR